jgi:hypothetical protein
MPNSGAKRLNYVIPPHDDDGDDIIIIIISYSK